MAVQRFDIGRLDRAQRTGAGGARVPATIARTGVQVYQDANGKTVREYRSPEAVFAAESLNTLGSIPVTIGHPGAVTPANWRSVSVGHVSDAPPARKQDAGAEWLETAVIVNDAKALERISSGDLAEVSMGYTADVLPKTGVAPDGQHYDAVQTNIQFNHLALLEHGRARAGGGAKLRLDSKGNEQMFRQDDSGTKPKVKVDGIEVEAGSDTHIQMLERSIASETARADAAVAAAAAAQTAAGEAKAKLDAAATELAALKAQDVAKLVQDELDFRSRVLPALPAKYDFTGKSRDRVRADAVGAEVVANAAKLPEGERAGYLTAHLQIKLDAAAKPKVPTHTPTGPTSAEKTDDKPTPRKDPRAEAYKASFAGGAK